MRDRRILRNPFVAGGMITDRHLFVGRKAELAEITALMTTSPATSVNIYGE